MKTAEQVRAESAQRITDRIAFDLGLLDALFELAVKDTEHDYATVELSSQSTTWVACNQAVEEFKKILTASGYEVLHFNNFLMVTWND